MQYKVPIHVRHSFSGKPGTWVREGATMMERPSVVGVTTDRKVAKVTLLDVKDQPGIAAHVFRDLADAEINVRLIIQAAPSHERNRITFIIESDDIDALKALIPTLEEEQDRRPRRDRHRRRQDRHRRLAHRLDAGPRRAACSPRSPTDSINIDCISTSEMKVSCIIAEKHLDDAARAVHADVLRAGTSASDEAPPRKRAEEAAQAPRSDAPRRRPRRLPLPSDSESPTPRARSPMARRSASALSSCLDFEFLLSLSWRLGGGFSE